MEEDRIQDKKTRKGRLFVISGPSGSGKSTFIERFLKQDKTSTFSVSYTTRKKRDKEVDGREYYFVDKKTFMDMVEKGGFLEWEVVHENLYGTPKKEIIENLERGIDILLDVDVNGAINIKKNYPDACLIFIEPPSREELVKRLSFRGEEQIELRLKRYDEEIEKKHIFDYTVINDNLERAYRDFEKIIEHVRGH
ncbi:MAG TPA: guanylate kinase [Syntrophorhabdaceae bacterium]|nr:guanylate kinase [Syntrophorhabdaceae bacterium]HON85039.1 guanylate kinase [Syntrophorhabdaceae bacterium]HOT41542.1 guanylate kinase [Syntrophorhabdaceae bacterium]HPC65840.1 guanylate kinase [Syntrophorhabdaceae bacterium]HQE79534.1 guanylate kinase [Syntrophorhabdaceae bacterium]